MTLGTTNVSPVAFLHFTVRLPGLGKCNPVNTQIYNGYLYDAQKPCGGFSPGGKAIQSELKLCKCVTIPTPAPVPATQTENACYNSYTAIGCGVSNVEIYVRVQHVS